MSNGPDIRQYDAPTDACPACRHETEAVTGAKPGSGPPRPGDLTVCAYCGAVLAFGEGLKLREATDDDLHDLGDDTRRHLGVAQCAAAHFRRDREARA